MVWDVIVGNIGSVCQGTSEREARRVYREYVAQSKSGVGRAGNEPVALFKGSEIVAEHDPEPHVRHGVD